MRSQSILAAGLCAAALLFNGERSFAHDPAEHKAEAGKVAEPKPKEHKEGQSKVKIPDTLHGIWKEIHTHHLALGEVVKEKRLSEVHEHAFAIRDLAKALPSKAGQANKKPIENLVKKIGGIAAELDKSGDAGNQQRAEAGLKKLDEALAKLQDQFQGDHH